MYTAKPILVFQCIFVSIFSNNVDSLNFDKELLTVAFDPYNKLNDPTTPPSLNEVQDMLKVVSSRFQNVYISHSGAITDSPWNSSRNMAHGLTPVAAANLNKQQNTLILLVKVGIKIRNSVEDEWELGNAIESSSEANKIFPGTVTSMFLSFSDFSSIADDFVINWFFKLRQKVKQTNGNITLGIYADECDELHSLASFHTQLNESVRLKVFSGLDFLVCNTHTNVDQVRGMEDFKRSLSSFLANKLLLENMEIKESNSLISIIPLSIRFSLNVSESNQLIYSPETLVNYWQAWNDWAIQNNHHIWLDGAFDANSSGKSFYRQGWWERLNDYSSRGSTFQEKSTLLVSTGTSYYTYYLAIALIMIVSSMCIMLLIWRYYTKTADKERITEFDFKKRSRAKQKYSQDDLALSNVTQYDIRREDVKIDELTIMGKGTFGEVYKAQIKGGPWVAVKTIGGEAESASSLRCFLSEIKVLIHVGTHENVVSFIGADTSQADTGTVLIFLELCELGSLETYLRKNLITVGSKSSKLKTDVTEDAMSELSDDDTKLVKWSYQISCGMEHISSKKVIHADLATRNVLLTNEGVAKITDFGLSKRLYEYASYAKSNAEFLPWRWMAVESLQTMKFTTASDVWAFGITLWEIYSDGRIPYAGMMWTANFTERLEGGLQLHKPYKASDEMYLKMVDCWNLDSDSRPNFKELKEFFALTLRRQNEEMYLPSEKLLLTVQIK